jgi:hypothetical protein
MTNTELLEKHKAQSMHYLENAYKFIDAGDAEKASEFLWGSMAQAIKAVAATKELALKSHRDLWDYADALSKELGDKSIYDSFLHANSLHSNFYECELELKDVIRVAEEVRTTIAKLLSLIPTEQS